MQIELSLFSFSNLISKYKGPQFSNSQNCFIISLYISVSLPAPPLSISTQFVQLLLHEHQTYVYFFSKNMTVEDLQAGLIAVERQEKKGQLRDNVSCPFISSYPVLPHPHLCRRKEVLILNSNLILNSGMPEHINLPW